MGSGNGRTGTQKLKRYDLEDFNPRRSAEPASDAGPTEQTSAGARDELGGGGVATEEPAPAIPETATPESTEPKTTEPVPAMPETTEPVRVERRSPADAYRPLHDFLETFESDTVMISFAALENMIKRKLPPSARERVTWWTNKPRGRGHAKAWRDLGWQVEHVDLRKGRVTFTRLG